MWIVLLVIFVILYYHYTLPDENKEKTNIFTLFCVVGFVVLYSFFCINLIENRDIKINDSTNTSVNADKNIDTDSKTDTDLNTLIETEKNEEKLEEDNIKKENIVKEVDLGNDLIGRKVYLSEIKDKAYLVYDDNHYILFLTKLNNGMKFDKVLAKNATIIIKNIDEEAYAILKLHKYSQEIIEAEFHVTQEFIFK